MPGHSLPVSPALCRIQSLEFHSLTANAEPGAAGTDSPGRLRRHLHLLDPGVLRTCRRRSTAPRPRETGAGGKEEARFMCGGQRGPESRKQELEAYG